MRRFRAVASGIGLRMKRGIPRAVFSVPASPYVQSRSEVAQWQWPDSSLD